MASDTAYIASVVATYWFVSISMVYLNKILMSSESVSLSGAPLFVTWFQCIVTALICWLAGEVAAKFKKAEYEALAKSSDGDGGQEDAAEKSKSSPSFWSQFPKQQYKVGLGTRVMPLSLIFVGMITFNNLCLKWVEVSFYNVARSLTIVFNVGFSQAVLGQRTSTKTLGCLAIVILGFFMGSQGEINFSYKGTVAGMLSSLFVSLNGIYTKKILPVVDNDHWLLTYYNNMNASLLFLPLIVIFEHDAIYAALGQQFLNSVFWAAMMVAGFFGFSIGIVTVLQIKATSPLSHNISGTAKAAVQSMLAFYIWGNEWTVMGIVSIFVVLGGSLLYTIVKMKENKAGGRPAGSNKPVVKPVEPAAATKEEDIELASPKR